MIQITRSYLSVNGFHIYWYGVIIGFAAALAVLLASKREKIYGLKKDTMLDAALICLPAGLAGARLYYVLMKPGEFTSLISVLDLRSGGLAIYGGLILGLIAAGIFTKARRLSFITLFDTAAPCIALAQGLGRWGNFLNQEAYGIRITCSSLQFFPLAVFIDAEHGWFAAAFFYESVWCLLTAFIIFRRRDTRRGISSLTYLSMYAAERCILEGLRMDSLYIGAFRTSQLISALLLSGICVYVCMKAGRYTALAFSLLSAALIAAGILTGLLPLTAAGAVSALALTLRCLYRQPPIVFRHG